MGGIISSTGSQNRKKDISPPPPPPPWAELPDDVTANILQRLGTVDILVSAQYVCTNWHNLCKETYMWRQIAIYQWEDREVVGKSPYNVANSMCREAVDRSQGQLIGIKLIWHSSDDMLRYMSERSSQLRCLRILYSFRITDKALTEAISKLPNLEELHLHDFSIYISSHAIKSIGISCPNLKSFGVYDMNSLDEYMDKEIICAIAETMHGLRHLKFFGKMMTDIHVQTILDGCPYLESLDFQDCPNGDLSEELLERCSQQIPDFRGPYYKSKNRKEYWDHYCNVICYGLV